MAVINVVPQQAVISLKAYLGPSPPNQQLSIFYLSADTLTGSIQNSYTVTVPAVTNYQAVNLATVFPGALNPVIFQIVEVTTVPTGFSFTTATGSGNQLIAPGGFVCWMGTTATTIYLSNTAATAVILTIGVISN
jgi:hypothetical protein